MKKSAYLRRIVKDSIRMYFAPITGAYRGIRVEFKKVDREILKHRNDESQSKRESTHHA